MLRLDQCKPGQSGVVTLVEVTDPIGQRMLEMGLIEGVTIKVIRIAPLGDPIEIELHNYRLSLRRSEAEKVVLDL